ncbi:MAG: helix-turn-helix domain-containing protein [Tannerellaceae bacterium]|nr:helix-turn-helix domain-containing protein [Tannerellaceae bacterium]
MLLNSDEGEGNKSTAENIAKILHIHVKTVERIKQRFVAESPTARSGGTP